MSELRNLKDAHVEGLMRANEAIRKLRLPQEPWVDAFAGVLGAGGFLMIRPLDGLCGAYFPNSGGTPGIMVNSKHLLSVQRFTAAHELGHMWMEHESSLDTEDRILKNLGGMQEPLVEVAANAFAAHFLMPRATVSQRIDQLGLSKRQMADPRAVYLLALWFGVSYTAMAFQLATLKYFSWNERADLVKVPPKVVKQSLMLGAQLEDSWSDVLPVDESAQGKTVALRVGDYLALTLQSHAAGGFLWEAGALDSEAFKLEAREENAAAEPVRDAVGTAAPAQFVVAVKKPGVHELSLTERRPFSPSAAPSASFNMTVVGVAKPDDGMGKALFPAATT